MRRTYLIGGLIALLVVAIVVWDGLSPGLTLKAMVSAAKANDTDRLSSYIDYDALRQDMKTDLTARLEAEARKDKSPSGQMGLAMGKAMMGPMVDAMISPQGLKAAFASLDAAGKAAGGKGRQPAKPPKPVIERHSLNRFIVSNPATPGSGLVFERRGLGWKLSGIALPPEEAKRPGARG
jgi:hypothetical protein